MKLVLGFSCVILLFCSPDVEQDFQDDTQKDLVLHYTFDRQDGEFISNETGESHPGRPNLATFVKEKSAGNSLKVRKNNEKSGYVETENHDDFNTSTFTVAAWIKLEQTVSNGSVVCKHDWFKGGARGFVLRCYSGEKLNFTVGAGG